VDRAGIADFLREWHRVVARRDADALRELLADGIWIGSPPYWPRFEGRDLAHHLLGLILAAIQDFTYHREWQAGSELALEFTGHVGELELQGIDLITLDRDFAIAKLDVMIRPLAAIEALREIIAPQMTEFLRRRASG
jgi:hypothetical protein